MKKLFTITIILIMALTMVACGEESTSTSASDKYANSEYLGTWELTSYESDGQKFPLGDHEATRLTLNEDGTFTDVSEAAVGDEDSDEWQEVTTQGTWEEIEGGFKTIDDIFTLEYKVKDNTASAEYESTTLIRKKID